MGNQAEPPRAYEHGEHDHEQAPHALRATLATLAIAMVAAVLVCVTAYLMSPARISTPAVQIRDEVAMPIVEDNSMIPSTMDVFVIEDEESMFIVEIELPNQSRC